MLRPFKEKIIKIINKRLLRTPGVETLKKNFHSENVKKSHLDFCTVVAHPFLNYL